MLNANFSFTANVLFSDEAPAHFAMNVHQLLNRVTKPAKGIGRVTDIPGS